MAPALQAIDHIHVFVADRTAALAWYESVLGLRPLPELAFWAADGGPLTLADAGGGIHLALFESTPRPNRSTIALRVDAAGFRDWQAHLRQVLGTAPRLEDHQVSWSLYFADPDGNPYEITSYDVALLRAGR